MNSKIKRCTKCVLPANYPGLTFNSDGLCSFCIEYNKKKHLSEESDRLKELLARAKRVRAPYQVIVPVSGGKDSAYALYSMVRKHGLRVLAVSFNNGFRSQAAQDNLNSMTKTLGVDYVSLSPNWNLMRDLYAAFMRGPGEFCSVCNAMGYLVLMTFIMAEQRKTGLPIPVIGAWSAELEAMPGVYSFDLGYFYEVISDAGLDNRLRSSPLISELCLESLLYLSDPRELSPDQKSPIEYLMLPSHMPWNVHQITDTLKREAGWSAPPEAENETHFDCTMYPVAKYLERKKFGFSQSTITYSALVRSGQMKRAQALAFLQREETGMPEEFPTFLNLLGITEKDVNWTGKWHPER